MENYSISNLMKAGNVKRWHTVDTVKEQSLTDHQWNVSILAIRLASIIGYSMTVEELGSILIHDIDEIWTGDMPSPEKERLRRHGSLPNRGVGTPIAGISAAYEERPPVGPGIYHNGGIDGIRRAADLLDAWWWSSRYVLDQDVISDCESRLNRFMLDRMGDNLCQATQQIMNEL